ncbi:MAG: hypothetical protein AAF621_08035, partial [Pseudomonadota bacterium]
KNTSTEKTITGVKKGHVKKIAAKLDDFYLLDDLKKLGVVDEKEEALPSAKELKDFQDLLKNERDKLLKPLEEDINAVSEKKPYEIYAKRAGGELASNGYYENIDFSEDGIFDKINKDLTSKVIGYIKDDFKIINKIEAKLKQKSSED